MAVSKVVVNTTGGEVTLIDLTMDTVTPESLAVGVTAHAANGEMIEGTMDTSVGVIPSYWRSYLENKATEINTALSAAGENRSAFLWYTDAHWETNYGQSPMILKYLSKHTGMMKTFFGGDIANDTSGETELLTAWLSSVSGVPNHRSAIGNHDNNYSTDFPTAAERAEFFLQTNRTSDMAFGTDATNGKMYYYVDDYIESTRYIVLSTGRMWTTADETPWCIDALNGTPEGWHIVIISHLWLNNDYTDDGATLNTTPPDYSQSYLDMFDDYNYRLSGTTSVNGAAYDFVNAKGKIEFIIGGHIHRDYDFATAKGIPIILTECDERQERDSASTATQGTTTENCVYAIVADYAAKQVKAINVGRGHTRSLPIPDVVRYTNVLTIATDKDGTLYNGGKGYKDNVRWSTSSNAETAATGWDMTGYIKCKAGDTLRFKNMSFIDTSASTHRESIHYFNADYSYNTSSTTLSSVSAMSPYNPVVDESGEVVQLTIPTSMGSFGLIRIVVNDINENSIITVNEEIG